MSLHLWAGALGFQKHIRIDARTIKNDASRKTFQIIQSNRIRLEILGSDNFYFNISIGLKFGVLYSGVCSIERRGGIWLWNNKTINKNGRDSWMKRDLRDNSSIKSKKQ